MPVPKFQFTVWWSRCFGSGMDTVEGAHSRMVCLPPGGQQASGEEQEGAEVPGSPSRVRPQLPSVLSLGPTSWQRQASGIQTIIVREELPPPPPPLPPAPPPPPASLLGNELSKPPCELEVSLHSATPWSDTRAQDDGLREAFWRSFSQQTPSSTMGSLDPSKPRNISNICIYI